MNGQPAAATSSSNSNGTQQSQGVSTAANGQHPEGPSDRVDVIEHAGGRILCVADIRGKISRLNELAKRHDAAAIIHTGDFGFYDRDSIERISDRTLRHIVQYSSLIEPQVREKHFPTSPAQALSLGQMRDKLTNPSPEQVHDQRGVDFIISEFPKLLSGEIRLAVPVYAIWGACEDIAILEKIRLANPAPISTPSNNSAFSSNAPSSSSASNSEYSIPNLTVISEGVTRSLVIGGVRLRLFGLGGSVVPHKLFDNGEGMATIAGGGGVMWTTALQIGELVDTAQRVFDPTETRLLITHGSIGREGLLAQLALAVKADFTVSGSLHFRYGSSYNDFGTQTDPDTFRAKFAQANKGFMEVYESVKTQVEQVIDDQQKKLLQNALAVARRIPNGNQEEPAWKNSWHWNLPDAQYGSLVLDVREGRVGAEMKSTGFNFAYRMKGNAQPLSSHGGNNASNQAQNQNQQQRNNRAPFAPKNAAGASSPASNVPVASTSSPALSSGPGQAAPRAPSTAPSAAGQGAKPAEGSSSATPPSTAASQAQAQSQAGPQNSTQQGPGQGQRAPPSQDAFTNFANSAFSGDSGRGRGGGEFGGRGRGMGRPRGGMRDVNMQHREQYVNKNTQHQQQTSSSSASTTPAPATPASASAQTDGNAGQKEDRPAPASAAADGTASPATAASSKAEGAQPSESSNWREQREGEQGPRRGFGNNNRRDASGSFSGNATGAPGEGGNVSSGGEGGHGERGGFRGRGSRGGRGGRGGFNNNNNNNQNSQGPREDQAQGPGQGPPREGNESPRGGFGADRRGGPPRGGRGRGGPGGPFRGGHRTNSSSNEAGGPTSGGSEKPASPAPTPTPAAASAPSAPAASKTSE